VFFSSTSLLLFGRSSPSSPFLFGCAGFSSPSSLSFLVRSFGWTVRFLVLFGWYGMGSSYVGRSFFFFVLYDLGFLVDLRSSSCASFGFSVGKVGVLRTVFPRGDEGVLRYRIGFLLGYHVFFSFSSFLESCFLRSSEVFRVFSFGVRRYSLLLPPSLLGVSWLFRLLLSFRLGIGVSSLVYVIPS